MLKNNFSKISIMILCGGFGKRLQPVITKRQKVMADVFGNPFITFILDQISDAGGKDVILCSGFKGEQVENFLGSKYKGLSLRYSKEDKPLGTAGAIINAREMIESDIIMVFNGDSYCNFNPQKLLERHCSLGSLCTLLLVQVSDVARYGRVNFDLNHSITFFGEKEPVQGSGWINGGVYCINRKLIDSISENKIISFEKDLFPEMVGKGLFAFAQNTEFIDIGTPSSYGEAEDFFSKIKRFTEA